MQSSDRGPVTLKELTAGLIWPELFRAVPMALSPARMLVAFVMVTLMMGAGTLYDSVAGPIVTTPGEPDQLMGFFAAAVSTGTTSFNDAVAGALSLNVEQVRSAVGVAAVSLPRDVLAPHWFSTLVLLAIWTLLSSVGGGAISRMTVCEIAGDVSLSSSEGLAFALPRWRQCVMALIGPIVLLALFAAAITLGGWALLSIHGVNVIGALLYGPLLALGALVVALGAGYVLCEPLLLPAIAAESTDWLDAVQRAYAYVLGRTGRLIVYFSAATVIGLVSYAVIAWLATMSLNITASLAGALRPDDAPALFERYTSLLRPLHETGASLVGADAVAARIIGVWERVIASLVASYILSYAYTASSILYLLVRRVNDGQDMREIWTPKMTEATMAPNPQADSESVDAGAPTDA